jgi:hypothetical protein
MISSDILRKKGSVDEEEEREEGFFSDVLRKKEPKNNKSQKKKEYLFGLFPISDETTSSMEEQVDSGDFNISDKFNELAKSAGKGLIEGTSRLGRSMGPLEGNESTDEQMNRQSSFLDEILPNEDNFVNNASRRGMNIAPTALMMPGGDPLKLMGRSLMAGFAGEGLKEMGMPEWAQSLGEMASFTNPQKLFSGKLSQTGKHSGTIGTGKEFGLTDKEIAPLIQSERKQNWFSRMAKKSGKTKEPLKNTKSAIDRARSTLSKEVEGMEQTIQKLPSRLTGVISKDLSNLWKRGITSEGLMDLSAQINDAFKYTPGSNRLLLLQKPIKEALYKIDPSTGRKFDAINYLYTKYFDIAKRIKPNEISRSIDAGDGAALVWGLLTKSKSMLEKVVGIKTSQNISAKILTSPRFQQLGTKAMAAIKENKPQEFRESLNAMSKALENYSPQESKRIRNLTQEEFESFFNASRKKSTSNSPNK